MSEQSGMTLGPPVLLVVRPPLGAGSLPSLAGGLLLVMPSAEGSEVGFSMVIARQNVVHVSRRLRAPNTGLAPVCAAVAIASQDAPSDLVPVRGKTLPSVRTAPLRHPSITCLLTWTVKPRLRLRFASRRPEAVSGKQ